MTLSCPYLDCTGTSPQGSQSCAKCRRLIKNCPKCSGGSRAFAGFCRTCGTALREGAGHWAGFRGGVQRLSLNPERLPALSSLNIEERLELRLEGRCRSLLGWDRHLVAVSERGTVAVVDVGRRGAPVAEFAVDGPLTSEPCIARGSLYVAGAGAVSAYALGKASGQAESADGDDSERLLRWRRRVQGDARGALLPLAGRLFFKLALPDTESQVVCLPEIDARQPGAAQTLFAFSNSSALAADPASQTVHALVDSDSGLWLVSASAAADGAPPVTRKLMRDATGPLADETPIAVMGAKIFAVLGEDEKLCRLDSDNGAFDLSMGTDSRSYALSGARDGLVVTTRGVLYLPHGVPEQLDRGERVKGAPVIIRNCGMVLGRDDGRLRLFDMQDFPRSMLLTFAGPTEEVCALASFGRYLAVGGASGTVKVFELVG